MIENKNVVILYEYNKENIFTVDVVFSIRNLKYV